MAKNVKIILSDDVDGCPADETLSFALDGQSYEIDLATEKAAALRGQIGEWIAFARKADSRKRAGSASKASKSSKVSQASKGGPGPAEVRAWAFENGVQVAERGRIPAAVVEQYLAATGS